MVFMGYCLAEHLHAVNDRQAHGLTHLNVAFGVVRNGAVDIEGIRASRAELPRLRAAHPGLRILLSIGGGDENQRHPFGVATRTQGDIDRLADSAMEAVREFGFDGIDCDWEYPCSSGDPAERGQHLALMRTLRSRLDASAARRGTKGWLTYAAPCTEEYIRNVAVRELAQVADYVNLMGYDFRWAGPRTGLHCNTYSPSDDPDPTSIDWAVGKFMEAGVPPGGIVLGAAFYSHRYDGVQGGGNGYGQPYTGAYSYGPGYGEIKNRYETDPRFTRHWHEEAKEPWLFDGESFLTYDDAEAMAHKAELAKRRGLAGMMYWEHGCDRTGTLFDAIHDALKR